VYYEKLNLIFFFILFSSFPALSRYFLLLTSWHDKSADCPYCLAEFDEFDEYDD